MGLVNENAGDQKSVRFEDADGNALPEGPLVTVTLQPSNIECVCRVASFIAGAGEGTWFPIQEKDEVVVVIPEGDESACPVIIARMNNELDSWPTTVAGADMKKNNTAFWRLRTPFIIETAAAFLVRSAQTTAQFGIDPLGQVIMNSGEKQAILIGADTIAMLSADQKTAVQVLAEDKQVYLVADSCSLLLDGTSSVFKGKKFTFQTAPATGTAVTLEQLALILINLLVLLDTAGAFTPPLKTTILLTPSAFDSLYAAMFQAIGNGVPGVPGAPVATNFGGPMMGLFPLTMAGLGVAAAGAIPSVDVTGNFPGCGRATFRY